MYNPIFNPAAGKLHTQCRIRGQRGGTLIELLVGVAVGLVVLGAAFGTMVLSQGASRAVNDQLELQQQGNTAMRMMAAALRQANGLELTPTLGASVVFTERPVGTPTLWYLNGAARDAQGNDDFTISFSDGGPATPSLDCEGNNPVPVLGQLVSSRFFVQNNRLMCQGFNPAPQPLISDVQRLRVLYGYQTGTGAASTISYSTQAAVPNWNTTNIVAVELCLELASPLRQNNPIVGNYTNCDGAVIANDLRTRVVMRQVVRLRAVTIL